MADTKLTALTADTAPGSDSLVYTVDDPAGTPVGRKVTIANLTKGIDVSVLTAETTVDGANDYVPVYDASATAMRKVAVQNLTGGFSEVAFAASRILGSESGDSAYKGMTAAQAMGVLAGTALDMQDATLTRPVLKDVGHTRTAPAISAGTLTLDLTTGNVFEATLNANVTTLTLSNPPASGTWGQLVLIVKQDATGSRTFAWPASVLWEGGTEPTVTATANAKDVYVLGTPDAGTTWYGNIVGQAYS